MFDIPLYESKELAEKEHGNLCWERIEAQPDLPLCAWDKPFWIGRKSVMHAKRGTGGMWMRPAPTMVAFARVKITEGRTLGQDH